MMEAKLVIASCLGFVRLCYVIVLSGLWGLVFLGGCGGGLGGGVVGGGVGGGRGGVVVVGSGAGFCDCGVWYDRFDIVSANLGSFIRVTSYLEAV